MGAPKRSGLARHFEGWQPGLLAVFLAGSSAAVAVPRPVVPVDVPEPMLDPRALSRAALADDALARAAEERRPPLDFDVRTLGSAICAYGLADAGDEDSMVVVQRQRVAEAVARARTHGDASLVMLRAFEMASFLRELRRWEAEGKESDALHEVGGGFVTMAARNHWMARDGRRLLMDDAVRRALFKKRWNELVMVSGPPFELGSEETRALLRFFIQHPPRDESPGAALPALGGGPDQRAAFAAEQYRLKKIDELATIDPSYPADLARGVVNFHLHRYPVATGLFRRYLEAHPDGALTLRAQNYLDAALDRSAEGPEDP